MGSNKNKFYFVAKRKLLEIPISLSSGNSPKLIKMVNVCPLFSAIISKKFATLNELKTVYDYEDALDLYEILLCNSLNEEITYKHVEKQNKQ